MVKEGIAASINQETGQTFSWFYTDRDPAPGVVQAQHGLVFEERARPRQIAVRPERGPAHVRNLKEWQKLVAGGLRPDGVSLSDGCYHLRANCVLIRPSFTSEQIVELRGVKPRERRPFRRVLRLEQQPPDWRGWEIRILQEHLSDGSVAGSSPVGEQAGTVGGVLHVWEPPRGHKGVHDAAGLPPFPKHQGKLLYRTYEVWFVHGQRGATPLDRFSLAVDAIKRGQPTAERILSGEAWTEQPDAVCMIACCTYFSPPS